MRDVNVSGAGFSKRADRSRANFFRRRAISKLLRKSLDRYRQKLFERRQRFRIRAAVIEDAEDSRQLRGSARVLVDEAIQDRTIVMRHDLRQEKLRRKPAVLEMSDLFRGIRMRIRPSAE